MTAEQIEQFADWLSGVETPTNTMSLYEVEGYLFALICAPEPVENEVWIREVFSGDISHISDDRLFDLMAFYNHIAHQVFDIGYQIPKALVVTQDVQHNFIPDSYLHLWSVGFVKGICTYHEKLQVATQGEVNIAFNMAIQYLSYFSDIALASQLSKIEQVDLAQLNIKVFSLMNDFAVGFAELVEMAALESGLYVDEGWE